MAAVNDQRDSILLVLRRRVSTAAIDTILEFTARAPSPYTGVGFQQLTGVASRVDPAATAFAHRGRRYDFLILSQWDNPEDARRLTAGRLTTAETASSA